MNEHANVTNESGVVELRPAEQGAKIKINGQPVTGTQTLVNKDRVMFGKDHRSLVILSPQPIFGSVYNITTAKNRLRTSLI